ncbi:hypothetical protein Val02_50940 [Virgisporangium aliadipatigenens]|uniref:Uncharacterized protein n=1 Tax=Virgisporangium aliadipatigenens TaxID=741659 RepID=A0A8J4DST3_9ACTN|nr:hypothetical protein [Virgisporangium aliadipatigenens]GIJ48208.1 hypothetical protein Val02_50940 [Virgisporangium aliadipatigenens]
MSAALDTPAPPGPPPRTAARGRLAIGAAVTAAVLVLAGLYALIGRPDGEPAAPLATGSLTDQLAARVVTELEKATPQQHTDHGHDLGGRSGGLVCVAEVYGVEPATAGSVDEVTRAYGYHACAFTKDGYPFDVAPKLVGPIVVDGAPFAVRAITGGEDFRERVRAELPAEYQERAFKGFSGPERVEALKRRYQEAMPR